MWRQEEEEKNENFSKYRKRRKNLEDRTADMSEKIRGSVRRYAESQRKISSKRRKNLVDWTADDRRMKDEYQTTEVSKA